MRLSESAVRKLRGVYRGSLQQALPHPVKMRLRRLWLPVARAIGYPISSPLVPRPRRLHPRRPAKLGRVLVACDLNRDYLDFWPSTRRAWEEIVGVEAVLVLVARPDEVPPALQADSAVIPFAPIADVHPTLQAQCIRLLYPALLDTDGAVLISDIDLYPLNPGYFRNPLALLDERHFVTYRDARLDRAEVNLSFNAAAPATWAEIFGVHDVDEVRGRLQEWAGRTDYDGRRGWEGWYTDQRMLFERLSAWPAARMRRWTLDDDYCRFNRLERVDLEREHGLEPHRRRAIEELRYSDYACSIPYETHRDLNELILQLAIDAVGRRSKRRRG